MTTRMTHTDLTPIQISLEVAAALDDALRTGGRMSAFRTGGGLRVVRVEQPETAPKPAKSTRDPEPIAYGEHPHIDEALRIAADDFRAGGRRYKDVYGPIEGHYWTGDSCPNSDIDAYILCGDSLAAHYLDGVFTCVIRSTAAYQTPEDIAARAMAGETITWTDPRGFTRVATPSRFPNGDLGCTVRVTGRPEAAHYLRDHRWPVTRTGQAASFIEALRAAVAAPEIEVDPA
jgi:hypothetical protein